MEKIEQQTNLLSTQIEAVSYKIETTESVLEKDSNDWSQQEKREYGIEEEEEARKYLRRKKQHLRSEEVHLLNQKTTQMNKEAEGMIMKES